MTLTGQMLATYISQAYVSAIGIICVPLQVSALGLEGYGLVGVLVMLQAWFLLLDFGRVALITRKAAHIDDLSALEQALQRAERAVGGMAIMGAILIASVAGIAASQWFKQQQLSSTEITTSLCLMAAVCRARMWSSI